MYDLSNLTGLELLDLKLEVEDSLSLISGKGGRCSGKSTYRVSLMELLYDIMVEIERRLK